MKLLQFHRGFELTIPHSTGEEVRKIEAGIEYVFGDNMADGPTGIMQSPMGRNVSHYSDLTALTRNFVEDEAMGGSDVLFWNGAGGLGDCLMGMPIVSYLHEMGCNVTVMCEAGHQSLWENSRVIQGMCSPPIPRAQWDLFHHHCVFDAVTNQCESRIQAHPLDVMAHRIGLNIDSLPLKHGVVRLHPSEMVACGERNSLFGHIGIFALASSEMLRRQTPYEAARTLQRLAIDHPQITWIAIHDHRNPIQYVELAQSIQLANVVVRKYDTLRQLVADVGHAQVCVSPDSMLVHLAGCMGTPFVALFSNIEPSTRLKYYTNYKVIWHHEACPAAPCFSHRSGWPEMCPGSPLKREACECIARTTPGEVSAAVKELLEHNEDQH